MTFLLARKHTQHICLQKIEVLQAWTPVSSEKSLQKAEEARARKIIQETSHPTQSALAKRVAAEANEAEGMPNTHTAMDSENQEEQKASRGLASANEETRRRVAQAGGKAPHVREDSETGEQVSSRGLASADPETRRRVAQAGGRASRGGGRKPKEAQ